MEIEPLKMTATTDREELRQQMADTVQKADGFMARKVLGTEGLKWLKAINKSIQENDACADLVISNYE